MAGRRIRAQRHQAAVRHAREPIAEGRPASEAGHRVSGSHGRSGKRVRYLFFVFF